MRTYNNLATLVQDPFVAEEIKAFWKAVVGDMTASQTMGFVADFERDFGGEAYIIENFYDLKCIDTATASEDGSRWLSVLETPDSFEQAEWLPGRTWALFWNPSSNAGGPSYFVPDYFVSLCVNLDKSMRMSSADGSVGTLRIAGYEPIAP